MRLPDRGLVVRQPWAGLIATGEKTVEVRSWRTHYRGTLLLSAAASSRTEDAGCAIAIIELLDCRPLRRCAADRRASRIAFAPGLWAWEIRLVRRVTPFPIRGALGLYRVEGRYAHRDTCYR